MKTSKKILSVLLAVIMVMSCVSVSFTSFAAGGTASEAQWQALEAALKNSTVAGANFSGGTNNSTVNDPDGSVLAAVEAYWSVFNTLANKSPAANTGGNEGNRTINQVNDSIKSTLSSRMGADYGAYNVANFITKLISGANVTSDFGTRIDRTNSTKPGSNLSAAPVVNLTVQADSTLLSYDSVDDLPDELILSKTFTVNHTNANYNYSTEDITTGSGCNETTTTHRYYEFYYNISSTSEKANTEDVRYIKEIKPQIEAYAEYFDYSLEYLVDNVDTDTLASVKNAVSTIYGKLIPEVWNHFYGEYKTAELIANLDLAAEIIRVGTLAIRNTELKGAGYEGYDKAALEALYSELTVGINAFEASTQAAKDFINGRSYDHAAITAFASAVLREIELVELRALKAEIEATVPAYYNYNDNNVTDGSVTGATLSAAKGTVDGYIKAIGTYVPANVNEVMPGYADELGKLSAELGRLITVAGYTADFSAEYAKYVAEVYANTNLADDSADLLAAVQSYDAWYTGLKNLLATIEGFDAEVAEKIIKDLDVEMKAHMDSRYNALHARVDAQIDIAKELYDLILSYEGVIGVVNINTYAKYQKAFGVIETDVYNFLIASKNFAMPQATIDKYNSLGDVKAQYDEFMATAGFSSFVQQYLEYKNREVLENDVVKTEEYKVTEEKILNVISGLDTLISSDAIGELLGALLGAEEGADFDLGVMLSDMIKNMLFTDSFINTVMQALYPLILGELIKLWEKDLPQGPMEFDDVPIVGTVDANITLLKELVDISRDAELPLFPELVATTLDPAKYADNISKLNSATGINYEWHMEYEDDGVTAKEVVIDSTMWDRPGSSDLVDENGALTLTWGVDAAKEAGKSTAEVEEIFYQAFDDALHSLKPLFHVLLANKDFKSNQIDDVAKIQAMYVGWPVNGYTIEENLHLQITADKNPGYANLLVPIYEALGAKVEGTEGAALTFTDPDIVEGYAANENSLADILRAVLAPIFGFVEQLGVNPLDTLISALPNLCYALSMQMVPSLLNMLKTHLGIVPIIATDWLQTCAGGFITGLLPSMDLSVGDMLDLNDLGVDLSDGINSLVKSFGLSIPAIDQGLVASLGELVLIDSERKDSIQTDYKNEELFKFVGYEKDKEDNDILDKPIYEYVGGKAYHINADKAAVGYYLLTYIFGLLEDQEAFEGLLSMLMTKEDEEGNKVADEEKIAGVLETLDEIGLLGVNVGNAIGAIVELFNQEENNNFASYTWFESEATEGTVVGMTPAIQQYLGYDNDWTREKASYLIENVDQIIAAVMAMVNGEEAEPFDIGAMLTDAIGGLFTNKNITALAKMLGGLDLNALLAGDDEAEDAEIETAAEGDEGGEGEAEAAPAIDITALLKDALGVDLGAYAQYADLADDATWGFEDGDKDGFVAALVALLEPLSPVVDFLLAGADLDVLGATTLYGYNGYDTALVPLLEALGCEAPALAEGDNVLAVVINAILSRIASLNSVDAILDIIPGLLYFVQSNGLSTLVRNLLQPVYVILDTIRPIYDVDLNELIGGLTLDELGFAINLDDIGFGFVFDIVGNLVELNLDEVELIIADVCKALDAVAYTSSSSLIGENGKRGAYGEFFDAADLVTVLVSFAISWIQEEGNADAIIGLIAGDDAEKAEEIRKYIGGAITIVNGIDPTYETIDWAYNFPEGFDEAIFDSGIEIEPTINMITYPNNWTEDTAKYVVENLDSIVAEVLAATGSEYTDLGAMLSGMVNIYSAENVQAIVDLVAGLLEDIDATLVDTVGLLLDADLAALKAYKADEGIDTAEEFAAALAEVLGTIQPVVDWLFFGDDFALFSKSGADLVTIKGAEGYAYGLAPILEALGAELPAKDEATVESVLLAAFNRVDEVLADPVNEALDLLPNIIYFLNANGVSTSVKNLLAGVNALMGAVKDSFGLEVDLMSIFNDLINGLLPEDTTVALDVANLDLESIFALVQELLGVDLTPIADILVDLCVGQIVPYTSASGEYGFKMVYTDAFAKYDMVTIIASCLIQIIKIEDNAEAVAGLLGEEIYDAVIKVLTLENVPVQKINWMSTDKADTDDVFSALETSEIYANHKYGPQYTEEKAQYIADNFADFVNNVITLLGLEINGVEVETLTDLLAGLVNGSVYTSDIANTLLDALKSINGLFDGLPAGAHIKEVLKTALGVDFGYWDTFVVPEFADDRAQFVATLCDMLEPFYPVLEWLLADADLTFFVDEELNNLITLPGAEGYAFGIIPLLEALGCEDIVTRDAYNAAVAADNSVLLTSILNPLLNRVDEILADPATVLLEVLPNLIYFINSNGVDTVVKNTLNAVYTLLNAIEPIAKIDLYELIGLDLATLDFAKLFDMLLDLIADATGYEFTTIDASAIAELTVGKIESYTSANGETAYRMVYQSEAAEAEMVTVVERLIITFIMHDKNREALIGLLKDNLGMSEDAAKYVNAVLDLIGTVSVETYLGMDNALSIVYYIFYGVDTAVGATSGFLGDINAKWQAVLKQLGKSDNPDELTIGNWLAEVLDMTIGDILGSEGVAQNGLIAFFQRIIEFFQKIIDWFKNLFN